MPGSLTVVGTGIQSGQDTTPAAREHIRRADKVLYLASERITATWLHKLNATAESLDFLYAFDKPRQSTYREMVEHVLSFVRRGLDVCVVCYGHPGVFADPMHESLRCARSEGFAARMLPGVSSIDWLYADLGLDPADGCQIYEAADFLLNPRRFDVRSGLVLLQIGLIGETNLPRRCNAAGFGRLLRYLGGQYGADHEVVIYEAAQLAIADPLVMRVPLKLAYDVSLSLASTMYVPPKEAPTPGAEMRARLGVSR